MPPKRTSTDPDAPTSSSQSSKKAKVGNGTKKPSNSSSKPSEIIRRSRWSAVSGSANADNHYIEATKDPAQAYEYLCICQPPWYDDEDDEDEEDEGDQNCA